MSVSRLVGWGSAAGIALGFACESRSLPSIDVAVHLTEVEEWRAYRYDLLHREGWLSLTGLHWLSEGRNTIGGASDNDIVFAGRDLPPRIGVLTLLGGQVEIAVTPGVDVRRGAHPVNRLTLETDADTDRDTTVLSLGSLSWHIIERGERLAVRVRDTLAPTLVGFNGIEAFPVTTDWRRDARFEWYDPPKTIRVPNYTGTVNDSPSPGAVAFDVDGRTYTLDVLGEPADSMFWIQFGDETNGIETYGGGRYIWVDAPGPDGRLIIDFNKSYNPPCVFTPYATCPLPPRQNKLPFRIDAGEKQYDVPASSGSP